MIHDPVPIPLIWVSWAAVLAIHAQVDVGLLDSAHARPRQIASYAAPDLYDLAAAYAGGILQNHNTLRALVSGAST